jgi:hypothetical protein
MSTAVKPDLDSPEHIRRFVHAFYAHLLNDEQLAPIFLDVAQIDLQKHLPLICSYWEKLLLALAVDLQLLGKIIAGRYRLSPAYDEHSSGNPFQATIA